jgi:hypothetical protein
MFIDNIGTIRCRMALSFIAGMFTTVAVALTTPFAKVFLPHTSHNIVVPVPPDFPNSLKHDFLAAIMNQHICVNEVKT